MKIGSRTSSSRSSSFRNLLLDTISGSHHSRSKNKKNKSKKKGQQDNDVVGPEEGGVPVYIDVCSSHGSKQMREPQQDGADAPPTTRQPPRSPKRKTDLSSGTLVRAIVVKDTKITPVGLTLWDVYGDGQPPRIYDILPESAADHTKLEPGFVVEAISYSNKDCGLVDVHFGDEYYTASYFKSNGQSTKVVTLEDVQTILADAPAGPLTVRARVA